MVPENIDEFRKYVRSVAESEVKRWSMLVDKEDRFAEESVRAVFNSNLAGVIIPKEYGGLGLSTKHFVILLEELTRVCPSTGVTFDVTSGLVAEFLVKFASEEIKSEYLPKIASGEYIGAFGLTEPCCGSDAGNLKTRAEEVEGGFRIYGQKVFITNGGVANFVITMAKTDPEKGKGGITAFLVDTKSEGFNVIKNEDKLGWRGSITSAISYDGVFVPYNKIIGKRGEGLKYALSSLDAGRIAIAAMATGTIMRALEISTEYVKKYNLIGNESYAFRVADILSMLETAREYTFKAAEKNDKGEKCCVGRGGKAFQRHKDSGNW